MPRLDILDNILNRKPKHVGAQPNTQALSNDNSQWLKEGRKSNIRFTNHVTWMLFLTPLLLCPEYLLFISRWITLKLSCILQIQNSYKFPMCTESQKINIKKQTQNKDAND